MIDKGHIGAFSVRWEETEEPVYRVNLPSDHPAFVDTKKATGRQRWGMYFEKWRLLEGSVVTLGADPAALVGRMQEAQGDVRAYWRKAINHALTERAEVAGLVGVHLENGEIAYTERAVYDAMLEDANARYMAALDTLDTALEAREDANEALTEALNFRDTSPADLRSDTDTNVQIRSEVEPGSGDEPTDAATREPGAAATEPAAPSPKAAAQPTRAIDVADLLTLLGKKLDESGEQMRADVERMLDHARGRVSP